MPTFPLEDAYRAERAAFVATVESLHPDVFASGPTLCTDWAPRDVLAHLIGLDERGLDYVRGRGIAGGNARQVQAYRTLDRDALLARARRWAAAPAPLSRAAAAFLLGDLAVHHQDVVRANGVHYTPPDAVARAVLREGCVLSGTRLLSHTVVPDDHVGSRKGFGRTKVHGSTVALGLWLAGRTGVQEELSFE